MDEIPPDTACRIPDWMAGTVDYAGAFALHHISVRAIPVSTVANYFINSPAARILSGTV